MEDRIFDIVTDLLRDDISKNEAIDKLLILYNVRLSLPIIEALKEFSDFCNKEYQIWGNSARFDCGILQNAYNKAGFSIPWDFRKERCVRTLVSFAPEIKDNYKPIGTAHNAVDDCKFQIGYCSEIWRSLNCH
jgi:hypothetical protein